jgi:hypothetical protein
MTGLASCTSCKPIKAEFVETDEQKAAAFVNNAEWHQGQSVPFQDALKNLRLPGDALDVCSMKIS